MTYSEATEYLFQQLPMYSRIGAAAYKKDLTNIKALCNLLGNPHQKFKTVHVGGTNGKGSVSHMLAAVLQKSGYKTGLYTSPHLYDFRERIKINGQPVAQKTVTAWVEKLQPHIEQIKPSFFEVTVAMAFSFFADEQVDVAVIEVGLGGRLDSTNIINPLLSVITNISYDHQAMLGNTLTEIATEKAGIIKKDRPVVVGEVNAETKPVFIQKAAACKAALYFAPNLFRVTGVSIAHNRLEVTVVDIAEVKKTYNLDLTGIYQQQNLLTALAAISILKKHFSLSNENVMEGLSTVKKITGLQGRWDVLQQNPTVVLDVAHNTAGVQALLPMLQQPAYKSLHIIYGTAKDKDYKEVLTTLLQRARYYYTEAAVPRALPAEELAIAATTIDRPGEIFFNVNDALQAALRTAAPEDLILVCGSIFLIAEVDRRLFET